MTKLFITGGNSSDATYIVDSEIIDLSTNPPKTCKKPADFPAPVGRLWEPLTTKEGNPLVCGGEINTPDEVILNPTCFAYDFVREGWFYHSEFPEFRGAAATVMNPNGTFWAIVNGHTYYQDKDMIGFNRGIDSPVSFAFGCALYLNNSLSIINDARTFFFNHLTQQFTETTVGVDGDYRDAVCGIVNINGKPKYAAFVQRASSNVALLDVETLE